MTTVFYSWQSQSPNSTNRGFIEKALQKAVRAIREDGSLQVDVRVDSDTQGVGGSPQIVDTIFAKIDAAAVFVADITLATRDSERASPNPNVLLELGWAAKSLGWSRIIMVANTAFGTIEELPFDLRARRIFSYSMEVTAEDKATVRRVLEQRIEEALRGVLKDLPAPPAPRTPMDRANEGLEANARDADVRVSEALSWLFERLMSLRPSSVLTSEERTTMASLLATSSILSTFESLVDSITRHDHAGAAIAAAKGIGVALGPFDDPRDQDYFRFLGHELFVMLASSCLERERFEALTGIVGTTFHQGSALKPWQQLSLGCRGIPAQERVALLRQRHPNTDAFKRFQDADLFLHWTSSLPLPDPPNALPTSHWRPWSMAETEFVEPTFLVKAEQVPYLHRLIQFWRLSNGLEQLKTFLNSHGLLFTTWFGQFGLERNDMMSLERLGTRGSRSG